MSKDSDASAIFRRASLSSWTAFSWFDSSSRMVSRTCPLCLLIQHSRQVNFIVSSVLQSSQNLEVFVKVFEGSFLRQSEHFLCRRAQLFRASCFSGGDISFCGWEVTWMTVTFDISIPRWTDSNTSKGDCRGGRWGQTYCRGRSWWGHSWLFWCRRRHGTWDS